MVTTHDRRVRVFVSSTLREAAAERVAARRAIEDLHLSPVMFDQGARPYPPQELYRSYLAQSDVFIGIYREQYGWIGPGAEISGLEDELLRSGGRPQLFYLLEPAPDRDPKLTEMIHRVWDEAGISSTTYRDPDDLHRLIADDLAVLLSERFAPSAGDERDDGLHPLPVPAPATPAIGRGRELVLARDLLSGGQVRLLTLTGLGGIGKTRLMAAVVAAVRDRFDVVGFADLAPVSDPQRVPSVLAAAFGIRPEGSRDPLEVLTDRLRGRRALLVADNFEQVLPAAAGVARLLDACPDLTALVTSRTALDVRAEHELPVGPLPLPAADDDPGVVAEADGVALFVARARQYRPDFAVTSGNAAAVAGIVRRLEGIPLAIEVVAARMRLLTPAQLLDRLGDTLDLASGDRDAPARQQTLRETIGWSYDLLAEPERLLLQQLSVFPAGWSLEGAEAVAELPAGVDLLDTLSALIGHSLVLDADGSSSHRPRLRMYDPVRRFAAERLAAGGGPDRDGSAGGTDAVMHRLARYLRDLGTRATTTGDLSELDDELPALRAVFRWAADADLAGLLVAVNAPLSRYLWSRGMLGEAAALVDRTAALPSAAGLDDEQRLLLDWSRVSLGIAVGRRVEIAEAERVLQVARDRDDGWVVPHALFSLALALPYETSADRMRCLLQEGVDRFAERDDPWGVCLCLIPLGGIALRDGDPAGAHALHTRALDQARRIDDAHLTGQCLNQLALDLLFAGDAIGAREVLGQAAEVHRRLPDQEGLAYCLDGFAAVRLASGDVDGAAVLSGAAQRIREVAGIAVWPMVRPLADDFTAALRAAAGDRYAALTAEGAALQPLAALDRALAATPAPG